MHGSKIVFAIQEGELGATNGETLTNLAISVGRPLSLLEILAVGELVDLVHLGAKIVHLYFPNAQVSHLGSLVMLPEDGRL